MGDTNNTIISGDYLRDIFPEDDPKMDSFYKKYPYMRDMGLDFSSPEEKSPKDYTNHTWIAFDFDGNVTVNISQHDYLTYQEDLSFDQLCASMGKVFIEFLDLFSTGKEVRIIDRLNAMPVNIFS